MALFSPPQDATPVWTLRQVPPPRNRQDDEAERQCERCHKWMHARDQAPRYELDVLAAEEGTPRSHYLCSNCAQRQLIENWLHATLPQTGPVMLATFYGATLWEGTSVDGDTVQFVVLQ